MNDLAKTMRVAAVQMECQNNAVRANLDHARSLVEHAVADGAELVLLPELMPCGYGFTTAMWDAAEPSRGLTVQWLCDQARRWRIYLGTSFLEADGRR